MPAKSKAQQRLMGMVHAYKTGKLKEPSEKVKEIAKSMSDKVAKEFAETKHDKIENRRGMTTGEYIRYSLRPGKKSNTKMKAMVAKTMMKLRKKS